MKNIATIVLSLVLAAAIIFGLILYGKYSDTKDSLVMSEKKLSESNDKIGQLNQEISTLQDQIEKNTEQLGELKNAKNRALELESTISMKDKGLSVFEEKLQDLEKQIGEEKRTKAALETELSARISVEKELQEKLKSSQSRITYLENEIAKGKDAMKGLQHQFSEFRRERPLPRPRWAS